MDQLIITAFSKFLKKKERASFDIGIRDIEALAEFFPELDHKNICIYFYAREYVSSGNFASFIPLHHPAYYSRIKHIKNLAEFSIVFSKKFYTLE